jgi:plastocyanin
MRRSIRQLLVLVPFLLLVGFAATAAAGSVLAGGGCHAGLGPNPSDGSSSVVKMDGCTFAPTITRVPTGTEVTFINASVTPHDVTGRGNEWGSQMLDVGKTFKQRFTTAGLFPYSCSLHPGMAGIVVVGGATGAAAADQAAAPVAATPEPTPAAAAPVGTQQSAIVPVVGAGLVGVLVGGILTAAAIRRRRPFVG